VLDADHIERILRGGPDGWTLEETCRRLIDAAKEAGGPDNHYRDFGEKIRL